MMFLSGLVVSFSSKLRVSEKTKEHSFSIGCYFRRPLFALSIPGHAFKSAGVIASHAPIYAIFACTGLPYKFLSVIIPVAKTVIDLTFGPCPIAIEPSQPMSLISHAINLDVSISILAHRTSDLTSHGFR